MNEPTPLRIEVRGNPHPQPRPRHVPGQGFVSTIGPRVKAWRLRLAAAIHEAALAIGEDAVERFHQGALRLDLLFSIPVPKGREGWIGLYHHLPPDRDNLEKPVMDELQAAKMIPNDGRIADGSFRKVWCRPKEAGLVLVLTPLAAPKPGRGGRAQGEAPAPDWLREGLEGGQG